MNKYENGRPTAAACRRSAAAVQGSLDQAYEAALAVWLDGRFNGFDFGNMNALLKLCQRRSLEEVRNLDDLNLMSILSIAEIGAREVARRMFDRYGDHMEKLADGGGQ